MRIILLLFFVIAILPAHSQNDHQHTISDTVPQFLKTKTIPTFSLQLPDSSWYFNTSIPSKKQVCILYFSPDCGHCQLETEEIISKTEKLKNLHIVMITSRPFDEMVAFAEKYKLNHFSNIVIGRDPSKIITRFYDVKFTPFSAIYNKKGKLIKYYEKGIKMDELITLLQ